jgi:hypothetical protein
VRGSLAFREFGSTNDARARDANRNVIDGNLQCKSKRPRPTGDDNRVQSNKEDQCRRM